MSRLFRIGPAAFDLDTVAAVDGDRIIFRDGKDVRVSKAAAAALLAALPEWKGDKGEKEGGK